MTDALVAFLTARYDEEQTNADPHAVWQLDHDGYGTTLHAKADHAKAHAESHETIGDTYWRWDDGRYWLKRHGETIATIQPVQVLGADPARVLADIEMKHRLVEAYPKLEQRLDEIRKNDPVTYSYNHAKYAGLREAAEAVLLQFASLYAEHPDFDPAWRIDA